MVQAGSKSYNIRVSEIGFSDPTGDPLLLKRKVLEADKAKQEVENLSESSTEESGRSSPELSKSMREHVIGGGEHNCFGNDQTVKKNNSGADLNVNNIKRPKVKKTHCVDGDGIDEVGSVLGCASKPLAELLHGFGVYGFPEGKGASAISNVTLLAGGFDAEKIAIHPQVYWLGEQLQSEFARNTILVYDKGGIHYGSRKVK
ncbi:hypothetical protein V6N11_054346 [Hibiscus sabdariffa]|uniref:Uncharacterized protein n=1 Tax=Hibiscus sabdariffa TaxID=183260 RepID=A0ABR2S464_9ROSI